MASTIVSKWLRDHLEASILPAAEIRTQLNMETPKMTMSDRIENIQSQVDELNRELAKLKDLPDEPPVGAVVKFTKRLGAGNYTYAAIHTDAGWFMTGRDNRRLDWSDLLNVMGGKNAFYEVSNGWNSRPVPTVPSLSFPNLTFNAF